MTRLFIMGGSGGGNITQMAAKFAPHTFAVAVDCCGMPGMIDAIAFGTGEWGTSLNAAWSRDPAEPRLPRPARPAHPGLRRPRALPADGRADGSAQP
jgi:predicted acyl esterase